MLMLGYSCGVVIAAVIITSTGRYILKLRDVYGGTVDG